MEKSLFIWLNSFIHIPIVSERSNLSDVQISVLEKYHYCVVQFPNQYQKIKVFVVQLQIQCQNLLYFTFQN